MHGIPASLWLQGKRWRRGVWLMVFMCEIYYYYFSAMHFSIPNTKELSDSSGSNYTGSICGL